MRGYTASEHSEHLVLYRIPRPAAHVPRVEIAAYAFRVHPKATSGSAHDAGVHPIVGQDRLVVRVAVEVEHFLAHVSVPKLRRPVRALPIPVASLLEGVHDANKRSYTAGYFVVRAFVSGALEDEELPRIEFKHRKYQLQHICTIWCLRN
jgi:hypothetical protein